jgi:hypothetical protein
MTQKNNREKAESEQERRADRNEGKTSNIFKLLTHSQTCINISSGTWDVGSM